MPFANLPSSPGFTAPQAPDWTPFALEAIRAIEHQPIPNTAEMVNQAVQQIDHILELSSPQARMARELQLQQFMALRDTWKDYKKNPNKYQMTAHGPMLKDPYELALKRSIIRKNISSSAQLDRQGNPIPLIGEIDNISKQIQSGRVKVEKVDSPPPSFGTVVGGTGSVQQNQEDNSNASSDAEDMFDLSQATTETDSEGN